MKYRFVFLVSLFLSMKCLGQESTITLNLQQIEFNDAKLNKTLLDIVSAEKCCFCKENYYELDFFQSSLHQDEFFLSMDEFVVSDKISESLNYYTIIDDKVFFVSNKISSELYELLPTKSQFTFEMDNFPDAEIGGDYYFLIRKTRRGDYWTLIKTCLE